MFMVVHCCAEPWFLAFELVLPQNIITGCAINMIEPWDVYDLPTSELLLNKTEIERALSHNPSDARMLELQRVVLQEIRERDVSTAILNRLYKQGEKLISPPRSLCPIESTAVLPDLGSAPSPPVPTPTDAPLTLVREGGLPAPWGVRRRIEMFDCCKDIITGVKLEKNEFNTNKPKKIVRHKSVTPIPTAPKKIVPLPRPASCIPLPPPCKYGVLLPDLAHSLRRKTCKSVTAAVFAVLVSSVEPLALNALAVPVLCSAVLCLSLKDLSCRALVPIGYCCLITIAGVVASHITLRALANTRKAVPSIVLSALCVVTIGSEERRVHHASVLACKTGVVSLLIAVQVEVIELEANKTEKARLERENDNSSRSSSPLTPEYESLHDNDGAVKRSVIVKRKSRVLTPPPRPTADPPPETKAPRYQEGKAPKHDYAKLFPSFGSLWVSYEKHGKGPGQKHDEKYIIEEASREIVCACLATDRHTQLDWALAVLDDNGSACDDSDDDTSYPNKPMKRMPKTLTSAEVSEKLCGLLADESAKRRLEEAGYGMGFCTQRNRYEVCELVRATFAPLSEWSESHSQAMVNYLWMWRKPRIRTKYLFRMQRINHYPGTVALTRKDYLKKSLHRFRRLPGKTGDSFNIFPETYALPQDSVQFIEATGLTIDRIRLQQLATGVKGHYSDTCGVWITKPVGMSRGRGIQIVTHPASIDFSESLVIQRYIPNPLLVYGHKFDMRLYVVACSFQPLEAYLSTLGFARFSSLPFTMDPSSFSNKLVHLTNTTIQASSVPPSFCDAKNMCKWGLDQLEAVLPGLTGIPWERVWGRVTECLVKCLAAADVTITNQEGCFELLGFDVLLDENCEPWVLEVNASPSLEIETPLDERVKTQLMRDCLSLVNPQPFNKYQLMEVLSRRLAAQLASRKSVSTRHTAPVRDILNDDLAKILADADPAAKPEPSSTCFERIAPSPLYDRITRMMRL